MMPYPEVIMPLYSLEQVTKIYPGAVALSSVTLSVRAGEKVAIVGPSGSGKTTLLHLMAGLVQPDSGSITLAGRRLSDIRAGRELSQLVGVVHQQFDLVPHLSVVHNVLAGRLGRWGLVKSLASLVSPRERHLALSALERVGLADKLHERTSRLSGGEQQRVAIGRLLLQDPHIVLADEPVSSLDPARARDIMALLAGIVEERGKTLIASVHIVELARAHFDRIIGLRNGALAFDLPARKVTDSLLDDLYHLEGLERESVAD